MMRTCQYLISNAEKYPNEPAVSWKENGQWVTLSWSEYCAKTIGVARSLIAMGFEAGDKLSIHSYNRWEFNSAFAAANMCGGVNVGVYQTCSPEEIEWVVGNSDSKIVVVGNNPMDGGDPEKMCSHRLHSVLDNLPKVEAVVVMDGVDMPYHPKAMSWSEFISRGAGVGDDEVHARIAAIDPHDVASLCYTSGTTGKPKGVMITHDNFEFEIGSIHEIEDYDQGDCYVSWLPGSHIFSMVACQHLTAIDAIHMHIVDNPLNAIDYCKEVRPHIFIAVPRIYEKVHSNLVAGLGGKAKLLGVPVLGGIIKKKAQAAVGWDRCKYMVTGAAPINPDILHFFHKLGIPLFEGWGLSESTAGSSICYKGNNKIGSVGKPMVGTEAKIADDGEILIRGRHIMKGYYNNPEATAEVMDGDWFKTGDVGKIDKDGYLYITGRKKELYISSGGKNIAPLVIEETMKGIPILSQVMLIGDGRKYCSALVTLDVGAILRDKLGLDGATEVPKDPGEQIAKLSEMGHDLSEYTDSAEIHAEVEAQVQRLNQKFAPPEQIKKFKILPRDLNIDEGELTPTLKIRRIQIRENWAAEIEAMYTDA